MKHKTPSHRQGSLPYTPLTTVIKPITEYLTGQLVAPSPFEVGAWTGRPLSFTPELLPPHRRVLTPSRWYADEPHSVPSPLEVIEVEVTDPAAPLHRRQCRALWHPTDEPRDDAPSRIGRWRKRVPARSHHEEIAELCRLRWNAEIDALAPVIGWHATKPGNHGEHAGRATDLSDGVDRKKARLKLKNKDAYKHFERQLAASPARGPDAPVLDWALLLALTVVPTYPQLVRWKQCRAERYRDQHGQCKRWADDDIQGGSLQAELAFRIERKTYSSLSINKCRSLIAECIKPAARPWQKDVSAKMFSVQSDWTITEFAHYPAPGELPAYERPDRKQAPPRKNIFDEDFFLTRTRHVAPSCFNDATSKFLRDHPNEMWSATENLSRNICWHTWLGLVQFRQFGRAAFSVCRCQYCQNLSSKLPE